MNRLTSSRPFARTWDEDAGDFEPTRHFLQAAHEAPDIELTREGGEARASIPQQHVVHSPDGFEWGYTGSGPAELALNVLVLFVPAPEAWRLHQQFKSDIVACLPRDAAALTITADSVREWIRQQWEEGRS